MLPSEGIVRPLPLYTGVFQTGLPFRIPLSFPDYFGLFFLQRPPSRSLIPSWSLPAVLNTLSEAPFEPLAKASLHHLTLKTAFLVAIASGQRRCTIHALSTAAGHIRWEKSGFG